MKLPSPLIPFLVLACIAGGLGIFAEYTTVQQQAALQFFSRALHDTNIRDTVNVHGISYDVTGGDVFKSGVRIDGTAALGALELAYAKAIAGRSPLMALPGIDPDLLDEEVARLAKVQDGLAGLQTNASDAAAVRSALYPTTFLHAAASVESARLAFIKSGSDVDEAAYERAQQYAASAYENDIHMFMSTFERIVPASTREYADATYLISREDILSKLHTLEDGAAHTETALARRRLCIGGNANECDTSALDIVAIPVPQMKAISPSASRTAEDILAIFKSQAEPNVVYDAQPIEIAQSTCTDNLSDVPLFIFRTIPQADGRAATSPLFIGDIRFTTKEASSQTAFGTFLQSEGVSYLYDSPTTHYTCFALADDLARLFLTRSVAALARETPLSLYVPKSEAKDLQLLESRLAHTDGPILEADAVAYVAATAHANISAAPPSMQASIESLYLQELDHNAGIDEYVRNIARVENINTVIFRAQVPVALGAKYLFYVRSSFLGLFMSGNPSFVGNQPVAFTKNTVPFSAQPYILFSHMDKQEREKAISDLHIFIQLHTGSTTNPYI